MIVVNFAHPLTAEQGAGLVRLAGREVVRVVEVPTHFDHGRPFAEQAAELVGRAGLSAAEWAGGGVVVNLPSFAPVAAAVLAEVHGLCGHFPRAVRLRPAAGGGYEVAELLDLQAARDAARTRRF